MTENRCLRGEGTAGEVPDPAAAWLVELQELLAAIGPTSTASQALDDRGVYRLLAAWNRLRRVRPDLLVACDAMACGPNWPRRESW